MELLLHDDIWLLIVLASSVLLPLIFSSFRDNCTKHKEKTTKLIDGWSPVWLARWRSLFDGRKMLEKAHATAVKTGKPCLLPGFFGDTVVLPPSLISWISKQPNSVLSSSKAQLDFFDTKTTMLNAHIGKAPVLERVVRRDLNSHLEELPSIIIDEIAHAFIEMWGVDEESTRDVRLDSTIARIVAQAANCVFVGRELARNQSYIKNCISYVIDVSLSAMVLNAIPAFLKPFVAPLIVIPNRIHHNRCLSLLKSHFTKLLSVYSNCCEALPLTYATWSINHVMNDLDVGAERTPEMLSRRIMAMNFATVHTSTLITNALLLDILSDSTGSCLHSLRAELKGSARDFGPGWNRTRLLQLYGLDSALRESMRLSGFLQRVLLRKVVAPSGMTLPDGTHIPKGTSICFSGHDIHHDPTTYSNHLSYCSDRFLSTTLTSPHHDQSQLADISGPNTSGLTSSDMKASEPSPRNLIRTAAESHPTHLVWGLGKNACPGRYFAVDLVKMIVSYAITHYEIEIAGDRPNRGWMEYHEIPPIGAKLKVRRRANFPL